MKIKLPKIKLPKINLAEARKAVVAAVGAVAELVSLGVLHGTALTVATSIISIATAVGVYRTPNAPKA
jgi:hypothetical protein